MTNPLLEVVDLPGVAAFCRERGLVSMIDNTCASPVNFRPVEHGFDLVVHSATKYLNGHSDIVAGVVAGKAALVQGAKHKLDHLGGSLDPHACFLLHRGLKTLALRVRHQGQTTLALARFLEGHAAVSRVHYPGLESHARHARARQLLSGFGGLLSFELRGGLAAAERFIAGLKIPANAPSLGGVESLVTRPATTSHAGLSAQERASLGIGDGLVRLSVGLEAVEDLVEDLERALSGSLIAAARPQECPAASPIQRRARLRRPCACRKLIQIRCDSRPPRVGIRGGSHLAGGLVEQQPTGEQPKQVLVVDDSASVRLALGTYLAQQGFRVRDAEDGMSGLE